MATMPMSPIRQKSANGYPPATWEHERQCHRCKASFIQLCEDGYRGLWRQTRWFCSQECFDQEVA